MSVTVACPSCRRGLSFGDSFLGRQGMCPSCEATFAIGGTAPRPRRKASARPRDDAALYLKFALELKVLDAAGAKRLESEYRRDADGASFAEFAAERGAVPPDVHRRIARAVDRTLRRRRPAPPPETRECPNCFERIAASTRTCRFCGVDFRAVEPMEACANCGVVQPAAHTHCSSCGADVRTGLAGRARVRKCPRCGIPSQGMESVCVACRTPLSMPRPLVLAGLGLRAVARFIGSKSWIVVAAILLAGGIALYRHRQTVLGWFGVALHGEAEAEVREAFDRFAEAIRFRDWAGAGGRMEPPVGAAAVEAGLGALLGLTPEDGDGWVLAEARAARVEIDGDSAVTYADLRLDRTVSGTEAPASPQELIEGLAGTPRERTSSVTWRWIRTSSGWRLRAD